MKKFLINLDRSADRLALFRERNRHVTDVERFAGIDGQLLSREDVRKRGFASEGFNFSKGSTGSAMSHMILWEHAIDMNEPITIIEDDVIISRYFNRKLKMVSELGEEWDFVAWG